MSCYEIRTDQGDPGAKRHLPANLLSRSGKEGKLVHVFGASTIAMLLLVSTSFAQNNGATTQAAVPKAADADSFAKALTLAPNIGWTTGTQQQTVLGGSALLSAVRSQSYCDPNLLQLGVVATASDSTTTKLGGNPTYLDSNDVRFDLTRGVFGNQTTKSYLGAAVDFFENNSLGVGLQQIYGAKYQYYFTRCPDVKPAKEPPHRWFASVGIGAGYMRQRLYVTANNLNVAVLPLTAQVSFLQYVSKKPPVPAPPGSKKQPPALLWYFLAGYMPALTDSHAYQLSATAGVQIPTRIPNLKINFSDSDLYMENAPPGHRRNYQNGSVSLVFSIGSKSTSDPDQLGACYGGDKLQRLYCYDEVTSDACSPPNLFRPGGRCSSPAPSLTTQ
jgi:hypothetical protein